MRIENDKRKKVEIGKNYIKNSYLATGVKKFVYFLDKKLFFPYKYNHVG